VTCKRCQREIEPKTPIDAVRSALLDIRPIVDPTTKLPMLTPSTYARRHCRCGSCDVCAYFRAVKVNAELAPWRESLETRTGQTEYRWPSVGAALRWYADTERDGYRDRSHGAAMLRIGALGGICSGGDPAESPAIRDADDCVTVSEAIDAARDRDPRALFAPFDAIREELEQRGAIPKRRRRREHSMPRGL